MRLDPRKTIEKKRFFRHGTDYLETNVDIDKPITDRMIANYSNSMGARHGSKEYRNYSSKLMKERKLQMEAEQKRYEWLQRKEKLIRKIKSPIPTRIKSFFSNLPKFTPKNIKSYVRAELSNIGQGPVSLPIYEERKKICGECPHRKFVEGYKDPLGFCTKCGCGANPRAQLTVKLKLPATSCPLEKWGESKGIYEGFWGRIRYILSRNKKG
jgi:hypothetical protein